MNDGKIAEQGELKKPLSRLLSCASHPFLAIPEFAFFFPFL